MTLTGVISVLAVLAIVGGVAFYLKKRNAKKSSGGNQTGGSNGTPSDGTQE